MDEKSMFKIPKLPDVTFSCSSASGKRKRESDRDELLKRIKLENDYDEIVARARSGNPYPYKVIGLEKFPNVCILDPLEENGHSMYFENLVCCLKSKQEREDYVKHMTVQIEFNIEAQTGLPGMMTLSTGKVVVLPELLSRLLRTWVEFR